MYVRLFILFLEGLWILLVNLQAFQLKSFYTAASRHRCRLDFLTPPHTERNVSHSEPGLVLSLSPGNQPQHLSLCLQNLFDTTVEKSFCIENRRLSLHHHFQLAHHVKVSMHGHVSCFLPCKSYMVFHGRRTPYFKYSVDKDLKMEDSYSAPLMVKWEDFCSSVCLHCLPFFKRKSKSGPFS